MGRLLVDGGRAHLELPVDLPRGRYAGRVQVRGNQDAIDLAVDVTVGRFDRVSVARSSAAGSPLRQVIAPVAAKLSGVVAAGRRRS